MPNCPVIPGGNGLTYSCSSGQRLDSECHFVCPNGTELIGSDRLKCRTTGKLAEWSNKFPQCRNLCGAPEPVENGYFQCDKNQTKFSPGDVCHLFCNEGFVAEGEKIRTCKEISGWWFIQDSLCKEIIFHELGQAFVFPDSFSQWFFPKYSLIKYETGKTQYRRTVNLWNTVIGKNIFLLLIWNVSESELLLPTVPKVYKNDLPYKLIDFKYQKVPLDT